jgi:hypothetical protein
MVHPTRHRPHPLAISRRAALIGSVSWATFVAGRVACAADMAGSVASLKGQAQAIAGGASRALAVSTSIFVGDLVRTAAESRLGLHLGNNTHLNLGGATEIRIDKFILGAGGTIELTDGTILFEHSGPPGATELEFKSPYGLIAVRGTRFYAGPSNGLFGVLVGSGLVTVTAGGKTVHLGPQQGCDIRTPGAAPSEPASWKLARIRAMQARVR